MRGRPIRMRFAKCHRNPDRPRHSYDHFEVSGRTESRPSDDEKDEEEE
jgi:hypothetical protein